MRRAGAHPRRGPGGRDRRGAHGGLDGPRRARRTRSRTGLTHFWSRSRQRARGARARRRVTSSTWTALYADCDADTLLVQVHQDGVACHTGARTLLLHAPGGEGPRRRRGGPSDAGVARAHRRPRARRRRRRAPTWRRLLAKGEAADLPEDRRGGRRGGDRGPGRRGRRARGRGGRGPLVPHAGAAAAPRRSRCADVLEELARRHAERLGRPEARGEPQARAVARVRRSPSCRSRAARRARRRRIEDGVFHSAKGYRVTLPGRGWQVDAGPAGRPRAAAPDARRRGMLVDADLRAAASRTPARVDVLARHLTFGLRDRRDVLENGDVRGGRPRGGRTRWWNGWTDERRARCTVESSREGRPLRLRPPLRGARGRVRGGRPAFQALRRELPLEPRR